MPSTQQVIAYRRLAIWQKAHAFALSVLRTTANFPRTDEAGVVKNQLLRAATSVPANIVEGYGSHWGKSFIRYLRVSRGSALEAEYWLLVAWDLKLIQEDAYLRINGICSEVIAMLTSAVRKTVID